MRTAETHATIDALWRVACRYDPALRDASSVRFYDETLCREIAACTTPAALLDLWRNDLDELLRQIMAAGAGHDAVFIGKLAAGLGKPTKYRLSVTPMDAFVCMLNRASRIAAAVT